MRRVWICRRNPIPLAAVYPLCSLSPRDRNKWHDKTTPSRRGQKLPPSLPASRTLTAAESSGGRFIVRRSLEARELTPSRAVPIRTEPAKELDPSHRELFRPFVR